MAWRDDLQDASFRGIPFKCEVSKASIGRRNVLHQYPFSQIPYVEDMGLEAGVYRIEGYVIQNRDNGFNYMGERDDLMNALTLEGPGTLVHPFLGTIQVSVLGQSEVEERFQDGGGMARFIMTFVQAGEPQQPSTGGFTFDFSPDQTYAADTMSDGLIGTSVSEFGEQYDTLGMASLTDTIHQSNVGSAFGSVMDFLQKVRTSLLNVKAGAVSIIAKAQTAVRTVQDDVLFVLGFPRSLADAIKTTFHTYDNLIPGTKDSYYRNKAGTSGVFTTNTGGVAGAEVSPSVSSPVTASGSGSSSSSGSVPSFSNKTDYGYNANVSTRPDPKDTSVTVAALTLISFGMNYPAIAPTNPIAVQQLQNQRAIKDHVQCCALAEAVRAAVYADYKSYNDAVTMLNTLTAACDTVMDNIGNGSGNDVLLDAVSDMKPFIIKAMLIKGANLPLMKQFVLMEIISSLQLAYMFYTDLNREVDIVENNKQYIENPGFPTGGVTLNVPSK